MTQATDLADATASSDPEVGLAAVASLRALLESLEALQVDNARERGWSWQQIAGALGVSKQAVHKKHGAGRRLLARRERGRPRAGRARGDAPRAARAGGIRGARRQGAGGDRHRPRRDPPPCRGE